MKYIGSCHCGEVQYEVETEIQEVIQCNCSHCGIKSLLLHFVPAQQFTLLSGENNVTEYLFNKLIISHLFCKTCGVESFARGKGKDGEATVAINARSLKNIDIENLKKIPYNGKDY